MGLILRLFFFVGGHASLKTSFFEANFLEYEPPQSQSSSKTRLVEAGLLEDEPPRGQASSKTSLLEAGLSEDETILYITMHC